MANIDALLGLGEDESLPPTPDNKRDSDLFMVHTRDEEDTYEDREEEERYSGEDYREEEEYEGEHGEQLKSDTLDEFDPYAETETTEVVETRVDSEGVVHTTVTQTSRIIRSRSHSSEVSDKQTEESQFDNLLGGLADDTMTTTSGMAAAAVSWEDMEPTGDLIDIVTHSPPASPHTESSPALVHDPNITNTSQSSPSISPELSELMQSATDAYDDGQMESFPDTIAPRAESEDLNTDDFLLSPSSEHGGDTRIGSSTSEACCHDDVHRIPDVATTNGIISPESNAVDGGVVMEKKNTGFVKKSNSKKAKVGNTWMAQQQQAQKSLTQNERQRGHIATEQEQVSYEQPKPQSKSQPKKSWAVHAQENRPLPPLTQLSQDHNQNVNSKGIPSTPPVNREEIHKFAPPPIAHNVRAMFESGQIPDLHEIKKTTSLDIEQAPGSGVYENEPQQLEGVVRASDINMSGETFEKGKTKNIVNEWKYKGQYQPKAQVPINITEDEGCVRENEPIVRDDVIKSGIPDNYEVELPKRGYAKGVLTKWGTRQEAPEKKEIRLIEGDITEPIVAENQPMVRDDVIHSEDINDEVEFEVGKIRNLTGYWATRTDDVTIDKQVDSIDANVRVNQVRNQFLQQAQGNSSSKQPFVMDLADNGPSVVENEPSMLDENVVRSNTYVEEVIPGERGRIRNMANRFTNPQDAPRQRRQIIIDRADGPCVVENEPIQLDDNIVRADMQSDIVSVDSGHTRSLMNKWKYFEADASTTKTSTSMSGKPAWVLEMEAAPDSGVYENEPEERPELVREADNNSEVGMELHTKEVKKLWSNIEHQHGDDQRMKTPELVRFTPPREVTPPRLRQSDYQSYQKLTFTPPTDLNDDVDFPSPPPSIAPPTESVRKVMLRQS